MRFYDFKRNIEAVVTGSGRDGGRFLVFSLFLVSLCYGFIIKIRSFLYDHEILKPKKLPCSVISIGNLTVGGTGKTPMTVYVAGVLSRLGYKTCIISRGYKGGAEKTGGVVGDGARLLMDAEAAGDEPFMMAQTLKNIPVLVGSDRYKSGMKAIETFSPDVILLDDAFQHRQLKRDIDLVLIDDQSFLGDMHLLPRGMLREPVSGLLRGDAVVLTRSRHPSSENLKMLKRMFPEKPVFRACHVPYVYGVFKGGGPVRSDFEKDFAFLKNAAVFIFSGISKNDEFFRMVEKMVKRVSGFLAFPDHHPYSAKDIRKILKTAEESGADFILTTRKDYVRIAGRMRGTTDIVVIGVRISFKDQDAAFEGFIREKMPAVAGNRR